ncbi:type 2 periplasmic-binding domain-containing protein [Modicisalibacter luteus]|uniref:LysR substrate-binding domain-containing protein n=1 Tax=Modicisalibacter luteus TaxID=453962 RepID=A0ABV7M4Z2_9GAMM|nr:hypothetical protein [Halomonas lutea]
MMWPSDSPSNFAAVVRFSVLFLISSGCAVVKQARSCSKVTCRKPTPDSSVRGELLLSSCGVSAGRIFEFGSLDAMLGCVAAGMNYALLPQATVDARAQASLRRTQHGVTDAPG